MSRNYELGKVLCKGSGLKAYMEIKLSRKNSSGGQEYQTFRYEIGNLENLLTEVNRQTGFNYVAGRSTAVGTNKGLRNTYGTITFSQLDSNMIHMMLKDIKAWNESKEELESASLNGFSFSDWTLAEEDAALLGQAEEKLQVDLYELGIVQMDDLPPVDIIIVGTADQIDASTGVYEVNKTYMFVARGVTFLSETFGISAGSPIHNVATKVLILGGVEPWKAIDGGAF